MVVRTANGTKAGEERGKKGDSHRLKENRRRRDTDLLVEVQPTLVYLFRGHTVCTVEGVYSFLAKLLTISKVLNLYCRYTKS